MAWTVYQPAGFASPAATVVGEGGSVTYDYKVSQPVNITATATPADGYEFDHWTVFVKSTSSAVYLLLPEFEAFVNSSHTSPQIFLDAAAYSISSDDPRYDPAYGRVQVQLQAHFRKKQTQYGSVAITVQPDEITLPLINTTDPFGQWTNTGVVGEEWTLNIKAIPGEGYRFTYWDKDGTPTSLSAEDTIRGVYTADEQASTYAAHFDLIQPGPLFHLTTVANPESGGTTTGDGDYAQGDTVTIIATAKPGYRFVKWVSDTGASNTMSPFVFDMPFKDSLWVAYFAKCTGLILRDSESGKILRSTSNGKILRDN